MSQTQGPKYSIRFFQCNGLQIMYSPNCLTVCWLSTSPSLNVSQCRWLTWLVSWYNWYQFFVSIRRSCSQDPPRTVDSKVYLLRSTQCLRLLGPTSSSQNISWCIHLTNLTMCNSPVYGPTPEVSCFNLAAQSYTIRSNHIIYIYKYKLDRGYWHKQWQGRIRVVLQKTVAIFPFICVGEWLTFKYSLSESPVWVYQSIPLQRFHVKLVLCQWNKVLRIHNDHQSQPTQLRSS